MWVGAASSAIWLTQNLSGMEPHQRRAAIASINRLQAACSDLSTNQESMSAYTSRLLQHLLSKVRPDATAGPTQGSSETGQAANPQPATMPPPPFVTASLNAATWSTEPNSFGSGHSASHGVGVFTTGGIGNSSGLATRSASPQAWLGLPAAPQETGDGQQVDPSLDIFGANFLTTMMPPSQNWDAPFPADDGVLWCVSLSQISLFRTDTQLDSQGIALSALPWRSVACVFERCELRRHTNTSSCALVPRRQGGEEGARSGYR